MEAPNNPVVHRAKKLWCRSPMTAAKFMEAPESRCSTAAWSSGSVLEGTGSEAGARRLLAARQRARHAPRVDRTGRERRCKHKHKHKRKRKRSDYAACSQEMTHGSSRLGTSA